MLQGHRLQCSLLLFPVVLLRLLIHTHAQSDDGFDMRFRKIFPCQEISHLDSNVSLHFSDILAVQANLTYCNSSWNTSQYNGFRMYTSSEANSTYPVVFIARQNSNGTLSFSIPLQPEGYSVTFSNVSRTLCPTKFVDEPNPPPLFYIDVFTSSVEPQNYSLLIEPVDNFTLEVNSTYQTTISPSSPQIYYFKMQDGVDVVTVHVATDSKRCAIVSVQNKSCPVNDLLENARSKGIYQTMSRSAVLTVEAKQVTDREFLLVLIAANYTICHDVNPYDNGDTQEQELTITIKTLQPLRTYWRAFLFPVVVFFILPYILTFIIFFLCSPRLRCVPTWEWKNLLRKPCKCVGCCEWPRYYWCSCFTSGKVKADEDDQDERVPLTIGNGQSAKNYQTIHVDIEDQGPQTDSVAQQPVQHQLNGKVNDIERDSGSSDEGGEVTLQSHDFDDSGSLHPSIKDESDEGKMTVPRLSKKGYTQLHKRYSVYGWNAITVGIFYALPAFQLVLSEQRILNFSGNQDQCYYNFKCAHPFGVLSAFNNVFSNIGYVLLGFLFIFVVSVRQYLYNRQRKENKEYVQNHGLPQFFGIYYAMGIALVLEGFMSAFYHICPNDANFQFDTAFMFIIGGLLIVKVFQKRHPDIHANAFIAFFSFAVILVCTLIGIYFSRRDALATRVPILTVILLMLVFFLVSFYYFHEWKWGNFCKSSLELMRYCIPHRNCDGPLHKCRFAKLVFAFIVNVLLAIIVVACYKFIDIATAILVFFLVNLLLFLAMYILSKLWFKEPITWLAITLPFVIGVVWLAAFYFFMVVSVTSWSVTPAESRARNKDCTLLDFYDNHDIWHFLSAFGMFFAFLFVLVLDDGVDDEKRSNLHIF